MSATGRGRKRILNDNYSSPPWAVMQLAEVLHLDPTVAILDPFAGEGTILKTFDFLGHTELYAWEIRSEAKAELVSVCGWNGVAIIDTLKNEPDGACLGAVITNVPYKREQESMEYLIHQLYERGQAPLVATLSKVQWLASEDRNDWVRAHLPHEAHILSKRPSFGKPCKTDDCPTIVPMSHVGKTCPTCGGELGSGSDAAVYAWFIWWQGLPYPEETKLRVLPYWKGE